MVLKPYSCKKYPDINGLTIQQWRISSPPQTTFEPETRRPREPSFLVKKEFSQVFRLSATGALAEIGLRTPRVFFHPPFTQTGTDLKLDVFSGCC